MIKALKFFLLFLFSLIYGVLIDCMIVVLCCCVVYVGGVLLNIVWCGGGLCEQDSTWVVLFFLKLPPFPLLSCDNSNKTRAFFFRIGIKEEKNKINLGACNTWGELETMWLCGGGASDFLVDQHQIVWGMKRRMGWCFGFWKEYDGGGTICRLGVMGVFWRWFLPFYANE